MLKIIRFFVGLWLIWLPVATVIFLFTDGAVGKVKSVTTRQLINLDTQTVDEAIGEATPSNVRREQIERLDTMLTDHGDNVNSSIYNAIKADPAVSDVTVQKELVEEFKDSNLYSVVVSFTDEGDQVNVQFYATGKSFMYPFRAGVQGVNKIDISTESIIAGTIPKVVSITNPGAMVLFLANFTSKTPEPLQQVLPDVWRALNSD